ncbi:MAG: peptidase M28, partial [Gammaproteobacteria bacterium]|nr:peptidase M28 [Gemmatimonadota bacterium]NIU78398.1 peptidase M28 [Gammaproteobacteria bacterium]
MESWEEWAGEEMLERYQQLRLALDSAWDARVEATGLETRELHQALEQAGALGILTSSWPGGW